MRRTNWLANMWKRASSGDREIGSHAEFTPGGSDVENVLRSASPVVPMLTEERSGRILAAALAAVPPAPPVNRGRQLAPIFAFGTACLAIALWAHYGRQGHPTTNIAKNPPTSNSTGRSGAVPILQTAPVVTVANGTSRHGAKAARQAGSGGHVRGVQARKAHTGRKPRVSPPQYTGPASQAQLARLLVVTAKQPPLTVTSRNAEPSDRGFARVSAYAAPDSESGAMLEYTVAGPASGAAQTSFSLTAASSDSREAFLKVAVDKTGPTQSEGSN